MNFEIYCDESSHEALTQKEAHSYVVIGGIWLPADQRQMLKEGLKAIQLKHGIHGEMKWRKLSPAYFNFYQDIVDFFFKADYIRFRAILVEADKVDNIKFNSNRLKLLTAFSFAFTEICLTMLFLKVMIGRKKINLNCHFRVVKECFG